MILRIAIQAKGRLFEETMEMLEETGIKLKNTRRTLLVKADDFPVEVSISGIPFKSAPQTTCNHSPRIAPLWQLVGKSRLPARKLC